MQYYRLWIYSCNVVLGITSVIFIIFFAAFVVADVRLSFLEGVELYHPTFFYAYGALILQCGVVQTIGCLGAQRLSHKLLSLYWTLLLLLTLGDIGVGLYWVFHLERVKINLRPYLSKEFIEKYSTDETFTLRWNSLQSQDRCCGVDGPLDFEKFSISQQQLSKKAAYSSNSHVIVGVETGLLSLPESCCTRLYVPTTVSSSSSSGSSLDKTYRVPNYPSEEEYPSYNDHSSDPSSSVLPNDERHHHPSDFGGGGRRGRTVVNLHHKKSEPPLDLGDEDDDEDEDKDGDGEVYMDYTQDFPYQEDLEASSLNSQSVVPDEDDDDGIDNPSGPEVQAHNEPNLLDPAELKRDIKSYESIHVHKMRHELHRKSQPPSLIDAKLVNHTSLVLQDHGRATNGSTEQIDGVRDSQRRDKISDKRRAPEYSKSGSQAIPVKQQEIYVPQHHNHNHPGHNKTNKLFPSTAFRVRMRRRRETRALSVTQVPAVSAPIQRRIVCHGQPEGLNHHKSYRNEFPHQRKTSKDKQERKTFPHPRKPGTDWLYRRTTNKTSKPSSVPSNKVELQPPSHTQTQLPSAQIPSRMGANEIEKLTKSKRRKGLVAIRKSQGIMTGSADHHHAYYASSSAFHFPKLASLSSPHAKSTTASGTMDLEARQRNTRNAEMNLADSDSRISQRSTFTSKADAADDDDVRAGDPVISTGHNSNSFADSYFSPLSSSSSTSHLEVNYPHSAIVSPSTAPYDQWQENDEFSNGNHAAGNNNSNGDAQKTLYVYGVGCGVKLIEWVDHVSGIMFILGFCIICFVKISFLVILRTEIQEMIEKINMIEPEELMSPSRTMSKETNVFKVSHPLLQNPHRASTVSAQGALMPRIKSPDGPSTSLINSTGMGGYRPNRHYLRRASNIVGGDRSRSHSNETVNMSMLMTSSQNDSGGRERLRSNPNLSNQRGSTGTISNLEERDPVSGLSITVPSGGSTTGTSCATMGAARYLRRSSTCTSSANSYYPYGYGLDVEPRAGPSSRFYQYFEPVYTTPHLYQQHHHHHYARNRSHSRNMSCGAILPLASVRTNTTAGAPMASYRGGRNLSTATNVTNTATTLTSSGGYSFSSTSKDENELIISVSLEHIASSDQDEDVDVTAASNTLAETEEEEEREQEKKDWAAATSRVDKVDEVKTFSKAEGFVGTKLQTFTHSACTNATSGGGGNCGGLTGGEIDSDFQRRNGNNNVDLRNSLPMSYIGTPV